MQIETLFDSYSPGKADVGLVDVVVYFLSDWDGLRYGNYEIEACERYYGVDAVFLKDFREYGYGWEVEVWGAKELIDEGPISISHVWHYEVLPH